MYDLIIIGGGAAGLFAALSTMNVRSDASVLVLEKSAVLLSKVRISGGGRCNVTHACFDPRELCKNYPRGNKELIGPFYRFQPKDTIEWFESRGVKLKTESDGRMFPVTDNSETIIEALLQEANRLGVKIWTQTRVERVIKKEAGFTLELKEKKTVHTKALLLATGSHFSGHKIAKEMGHTLIKPIPSLFTFNVPSSALKELSGLSVDPVKLQVARTSFSQEGPLLLTHFGFSGPAVLKLSAFSARDLHEKNYRVDLLINWLPKLKLEEGVSTLLELKKRAPQKTLGSDNPFGLPKKLWRQLLPSMCVQKPLRDIPNKTFLQLAQKLFQDSYKIEGKTTHKEEFVTCGGVCLKEVNFSTMESKRCKGLFFAGEILDIDAVTGGFNFQNAWTTAFIAGQNFYLFKENPTS